MSRAGMASELPRFLIEHPSLIPAYCRLSHDFALRASITDTVNERLFEILGNKCVVCGFSDRRALHFDHIYNDGHLDRQSSAGKRKTKNVSEWKMKYATDPDLARSRLQVLCANCNAIKEYDRRHSS